MHSNVFIFLHVKAIKYFILFATILFYHWLSKAPMCEIWQHLVAEQRNANDVVNL